MVEVLYMYFPYDSSFTPEMKHQGTSNAEKFLTGSLSPPERCTGDTAKGWVIEQIDFDGEPCRALAILIRWESDEAHQKYLISEACSKTISLVKGIMRLKGVSVVHLSLITAE